VKRYLEVGARTVDDVLAASRGGADRVELYSSPLEGALTPGAGLICEARKALDSIQSDMKLFVMIRPRAGDFIYSDLEFKTMQRDVEIALESGADGIMCGILDCKGNLDIPRMKDIISRTQDKKFSLHRAFDFSCKPEQTLEQAIELGCDYILTIAQEQEATFSRETLYKILQRSKGNVKIMLGLGADFDTAALGALVEETDATEYHIVNGYRRRPSAMQWTGKTDGQDDYLKNTLFSVEYLSEEAVREARTILNKY
jgi:copper homeostasis protein